MPKLIDDGQTIRTLIRAETVGLEKGDDFYCERRPTLPGERNNAVNRAGRGDRYREFDEYNAAYAELVAEKLVWWNVRDAQGKPAEINVASINLLPPALWGRLTDIAMGYDVGDLPTDASDEEKAAFAVAFEAAKCGAIPGDAVTEAARKN
ncbi:MAG TPA: hypothetical protein VF278_19605 [Pirellulales bacterium]